ncbi:MBL fold metallo-hydrolase [Fusobacterium sp.]|uniref:MBL fold metallo-hydrolase n=1 Tax=Fusobacterium sp. TaxID=68766 RepID=UPI0029047A5C|nr:MBL fold metallo-hydrolase [Fusobacterium sp.]MDU1909665.1 MBL fold metallo-hydrolase [Fusobacterium sp.]
MNIYYIYHSCFIIENLEYVLIFDYYKTPRKKNPLINMEDFIIKMDKKVIVFSSHAHADHFNPEILRWQEKNPQISYVLSSDIKLKTVPNRCYIVSEGNEIKIEGLDIKMYGSTDAGVSFWIKMGNKVVFHAGDLNWWYWPDDTKEEEEFMKNSFQKVIEDIKKNNEKINIAFFPVDPRLEENTFLGGKYFVQELHPENIIPMHFGKSYNVIKEFCNELKRTGTKGIIISECLEKLEV